MNNSAENRLRILVSCNHCDRQYDASGRTAGRHFRCACGDLITVPVVRAHDAAVVRCSSCGGVRMDRQPACTYCGADLSLHERDLHTVCPECMARISDRARYCHYCATPIAVQGHAGETTRHECPSCGSDRHLLSRSLGNPPLAVMECERCGGLWLDNKVFQLLEERAVAAAVTGDTFLHESERGRPGQDPDPHGRFYRSCPLCGVLMHRRNYGKRSGVLIDSCRNHGLWLDLGELETLLRWVRAGGLSHAQKWDQQRQQAGEDEDLEQGTCSAHRPGPVFGGSRFSHLRARAARCSSTKWTDGSSERTSRYSSPPR